MEHPDLQLLSQGALPLLCQLPPSRDTAALGRAGSVSHQPDQGSHHLHVVLKPREMVSPSSCKQAVMNFEALRR